MAAKKPSQYADKKYAGFPSDRIDPKRKKEKEWYLCELSAAMHHYVTNQYEVPYQFGVGRTPFATLRLYFEGKQGNISVKKKLLRESDEHPGQFKTKLRDVWQTYDVLPEFIDVIRAINQKSDYDIGAVATDEPSISVKETEKGLVKFLMQKETQDFLKRFDFKIQSAIPVEELRFMTEGDVDVLFDSGGYQLHREIAAIAACDYSKNICTHKEIENKCNDDLIALAVAGVKTYIDYSSGEVKYRYVDPANLIIPYSKYNDFRDVTKCGELRLMTIAEIKEINPNLTAEQLRQLVEDHMYMNAEYQAFLNGTGQLVYTEDGTWSDPLDKCKVWVLDYQWLSADYKTYIDVKASSGGDNYREVKYDYKLNTQEKRKGAKINQKRLIKKYQAIWVVGTEILLQYGECNDIVYYGPKGNKTPRLDYFIFKTGNKSLVERCIPHVDDINLNNVKLRISVASLPPAPRMVIQQQMLNNVKLGGIKQQPEDLISTMLEKGYLIVNGLDDHQRPIYQNGKAIDFLPSGLGEDMTIYSNLINESINRMRQVLGLPEGLDGTSVRPYQGVRTQEMAASASSNALFPTIGRIGPMFSACFEDVVKKWQILAKGRKGTKVRYKPLGERTWKVLELTADFQNSDFNIELTFAPTDEQKQFLLQTISQMTQDYAATAGQMGASRAEFLMLYKLIQAGKIDMAMYRIAQIEKRREMMRTMKEQRDIEANMEANMRAANAASEAKEKEARIKEEEKRKTVIVQGAQQLKTGVSNAYLKSLETETGGAPAPVYNQMMSDADGEIASVLEDDMASAQEQQQATPMEQEMM